jgi:hypothetical protein
VIGMISLPVRGLPEWADTGSWSAGWAIVVLVAGCALLSSPVGVRRSQRRMLATRFRARRSAGRDLRSAAARREVRAEVSADLAAAGAGVVRGGKVVLAAQVLIAVAVVAWSRFSGEASRAVFFGLDRLDRSAAQLGAEAYGWVLLLGLAVVASGLVTHRGARVVAPDQRVIDLVVQPVLLSVVGLLVPGGVLLGFAAAMVCSLALGSVALVPTRSTTTPGGLL